MSLDKRDIKFELQPRWHETLRVVAEVDGMKMSQWVERLVIAELHRRAHSASLIAAEITRQGISVNRRDCRGTAGNCGESSDFGELG